MCGYYGFLVNEWQARVGEVLRPIAPKIVLQPLEQHYTRRLNKGLIRFREGEYVMQDAYWWYQLKRDSATGNFVPDYKLTTFNARNLSSDYWSKAFRTRRGIVVASQIGESEGSERFLMQASEPLYLAALYQDWTNKNGSKVSSYAIVTRPPHPRFAEYHSKSTPLMLPADSELLSAWMAPEPLPSGLADELSANAVLRADLSVTPVKTYARAEPLGDTRKLARDICR